MKQTYNKNESKEELIKYCDYLFNKEDTSEFERGYKYGVQHIQDQLKKSFFRWS